MHWRHTFDALTEAFTALADAIELVHVRSYYCGCGGDCIECFAGAAALYRLSPHLFAHGTRRP
jgi:hypothetical protein